MIKTALAKLLTIKAAAVLAATAAGGVALAASTGALPNPLTDHPSASASAAADAAKPAGQASPNDPHGSPSPSMVGLCHAYTAGAGSSSGKNLDSPAFQVLITTAGGKDKVDSYCATVLAGASNHSSAKPESSKASDHATARPTSEPIGLPTSLPTEHASTHPTGAPSTHPTH